MKTILVEFPIYTFHVDYSGHVGNQVYIEWMEITRLKLMEATGLSVFRGALFRL